MPVYSNRQRENAEVSDIVDTWYPTSHKTTEQDSRGQAPLTCPDFETESACSSRDLDTPPTWLPNFFEYLTKLWYTSNQNNQSLAPVQRSYVRYYNLSCSNLSPQKNQAQNKICPSLWRIVRQILGVWASIVPTSDKVDQWSAHTPSIISRDIYSDTYLICRQLEKQWRFVIGQSKNTDLCECDERQRTVPNRQTTHRHRHPSLISFFLSGRSSSLDNTSLFRKDFRRRIVYGSKGLIKQYHLISWISYIW